MKQALHTFSGLLQLRPAAINSYLSSSDAARALRLFVVVSLIAGLGVWGGVAQALRQLTLPEQIDFATEAASEATAQVVAVVLPAVVEAQSMAQAAETLVRQQVTNVMDQVNAFMTGANQWVAAGRERIESNALVQQLLQQSTVTAVQIEQAISQAPATNEQLNELLSRANVTPAQAEALLRRAGVSEEQIAQVQQLQTQAATAVGAVGEMAQLGPLLQQLGMTEQQFEAILAQLSTTPAQVASLLDKLALAPEAIGELVKQVEATPEQLSQLAAAVRAEAVAAEPPLGTRPSRIVRLGGAWLSTPLRLANDWLLFGLVLLVVVKLLGGRAPLPKHFGAMALAAAPLVLLIGLYIPNLEGALSIAMAGAVHYYARILALVGLAWAALLLLRTLSVAHEISMWRAVGALALTWFVLYVLLPLATIVIGGYLLV